MNTWTIEDWTILCAALLGLACVVVGVIIGVAKSRRERAEMARTWWALDDRGTVTRDDLKELRERLRSQDFGDDDAA